MTGFSYRATCLLELQPILRVCVKTNDEEYLLLVEQTPTTRPEGMDK